MFSESWSEFTVSILGSSVFTPCINAEEHDINEMAMLACQEQHNSHFHIVFEKDTSQFLE